MTLISLKNVSKLYGHNHAATLALDDISLDINEGEFVAIMGPSGSGKSTLMNIVGLLDKPNRGNYVFQGKKTDRMQPHKRAALRREHIGFVFQSFNLLPNSTALDNVALPLTYTKIRKIQRLKRAEKVLRSVGLEKQQYYMPHQLSGGQAQRVAVARAIINKPSIVLADEPTGNLDTASSAKIMGLLAELSDAGKTVIMVTHSAEIAEYANRFLHMRDGNIELDTKDFSETIQHITRSTKQAKARARREIKIESQQIHPESVHAVQDAAKDF